MSQYCAANAMITKLRAEEATLESQLRALRHHHSLHLFKIQSARETRRDSKQKMDSCRQNLRLAEERRTALIASHSTSVRGPLAEQYRAMLSELVILEDDFRRTAASHMMARYHLQQLVIKAACAYSRESPHVVRGRS